MFELILIFLVLSFAAYVTKGGGNTPKYPNLNAKRRRASESELIGMLYLLKKENKE